MVQWKHLLMFIKISSLIKVEFTTMSAAAIWEATPSKSSAGEWSRVPHIGLLQTHGMMTGEIKDSSK